MIDLICVNYKTQGDLQLFLESYLRYRTEDSCLHIVDIMPDVPFFDFDPPSNIEYVLLGSNGGYAEAVNTVGALCDGEYLGIFNADTELKPGVISSCVELLKAGAGIVGPRQITREGIITSAGIRGTHVCPKLRGWAQHDHGQYDGVELAISVSGSAYFMRRDCWDDLTNCEIYQGLYPGVTGPFLPTFLYYEETWCSYHASEHDWPVVYNGAVTMIHQWHGSISQAGEGTHFVDSQLMFRQACRAHGIPHD